MAAAALVGAVACVALLTVLLAARRAGEEAVAQGRPAMVPGATSPRQEEPARPTDLRNVRGESPENADGDIVGNPEQQRFRSVDQGTLARLPSLPAEKPTIAPESRDSDSRASPALVLPLPPDGSSRSKPGPIPETGERSKPAVAPPTAVPPKLPLPQAVPNPARPPTVEPGVVTFMGSPARGQRFVILADASGSMSGGRFEAAKAEIARTLASTRTDMAVSVIFFANQARIVPEGWIQGGPNAAQALPWVASIKARGETKPLPGFELAFALHPRPDAIFFLTDGELPANVPQQVAGLNRALRIPIHTIQFGGSGSSPSLATLARDSGGTYRNVPVQRRW